MSNINKPGVIIFHHTEVDSDKSQFPAVERYHKNVKKFPLSERGFHVGYHKMIDTKGRVITARNDDEEGMHTLEGWNQKSIGICLDGNFNNHAPTKEQIKASRDLIKQYDLPFKFHWEAQEDRTCPGSYFSRELLEKEPKKQVEEEVEKKQHITRQTSLLQTIWYVILGVIRSFIRK